MSGPKGHPVLGLPTAGEMSAAAGLWGCSVEEAGLRLLRGAAEAQQAETVDPLRFGWEPSIWHVADALIDFPVCLRWVEERIQKRTGLGWEGFKQAMRERLGFRQPARLLLILGGQRGSKSQYAAKRGVQLLESRPGRSVYWAHMSHPRSVREQQKLVFRHLDPEARVKTVKGRSEYVAYKEHTGFSGDSFILRNQSQGVFINYMQETRTAIEGIEPDAVFPDELVPLHWVETLPFRLTTRSGFMVVGFTPVNGYTPTVGLWLDGAVAVRSANGYLCPMDGGQKGEREALGLSAEEWEETVAALVGKRECTAPRSRPEDCYGWLREGGEEGKGAAAAGGRVWERVPRVMRCVDPRKAVVFFHSSDNPYGNPLEVVSEVRSRSMVWVRERFYGVTARMVKSVFPRFDRGTHVVKAGAIPRDGLNFMCCDPAGDRNFWMLWARRTADGRLWVYREWPGSYWIPGVGVPGPWAIPSGRREGRNDGDVGEGQDLFGFGVLRYKFELARLEGWADFREWARGGRGEDELPPEEDLEEWEEEGAEEEIETRFLDARAASDPRVELDRPQTLQTNWEDVGVRFELAPGGQIHEGIAAIASALDCVEGDVPGLMLSEECGNTIYAIENWRFAEGLRGATKDPVDTVRWLVTAETEWEERRRRPQGGYGYGRTRPGGGRFRPEGVPRPGWWRRAGA